MLENDLLLFIRGTQLEDCRRNQGVLFSWKSEVTGIPRPLGNDLVLQFEEHRLTIVRKIEEYFFVANCVNVTPEVLGNN